MAWSKKDAVVFALALSLAMVLVFRVQGYLRIYDVNPGDRAPGFDLIDDQVSVVEPNREANCVELEQLVAENAVCV